MDFDLSIQTGFRQELEKMGLDVGSIAGPVQRIIASPGVQAAAVPAVAGLGFGALSLYDLLRAREIGKDKVTPEEVQGIGRGRKQVDAKEYVKEMEKTRPSDRPLIPITSNKEISKMTKDPASRNPPLKSILKDKAKRVHKKKSNAFMFPGKERDYIVVPEKVNPRVVEHEVGHAWDIKDKANKGLLKKLHKAFGLLWKPAFKKTVLGPEERAWKAAKKTPSRERALKSYEAGFHRRRGKMVGKMAIPLAVKALDEGIKAGMGGA